MPYFKNYNVQKQPLERHIVKSAYFTREECILQTRRVHTSDMKIGVFIKRKYND